MKLDDLIRNNLESFNESEPPEGHFSRFESKMRSSRITGLRGFRANFLKVAAVVVFIFLATAVFVREIRMFQTAAGAGYVSSTGETELEEAERYYSGLVNDYYSRLSNLDFSGNEQEKNLIMKELIEMDRNVELMKTDLRNSPENEIIINAIISHYQIKLELMDDIITRIEKTGNSIL